MSYIHDSKRERVSGPACLNNIISDDEWNSFIEKLPAPEMIEFSQYWKSQCPSGDIPERKDITPEGMKNYLANVSIIDVDPATFEAKYRIIGSNVLEFMGVNIEGKSLSEIATGDDYKFFLDGFKQIVREGRVLLNVFDLGYLNKEHKIIHNLALPLKQNGKVLKVLYYSFTESAL